MVILKLSNTRVRKDTENNKQRKDDDHMEYRPYMGRFEGKFWWFVVECECCVAVLQPNVPGHAAGFANSFASSLPPRGDGAAGAKTRRGREDRFQKRPGVEEL